MTSKQPQSSTEKKPVLLVFDLDYTLWPFWVDTHVTPPFKIGKNNGVIDSNGRKIYCYKDVPNLLKKLFENGFQIGVASRTSEIQGANQLIELFGWTKYITYREIYPGKKTTHFQKIHESSNVSYENMIFFDDENRNIEDVSKLGVQSILVRDGVTKTIVEKALQKFNVQWRLD
ncbi:magnesium-dependent phosphatase 1-like [Chelonus insularis]|uniref:magnesium-dependent phosphatase 1-like n=1 Tax=Chelonus insularis TaxID=460826 RepID=UPI00158A2BE3|nr:magnesium-dependent phosphatase 1-like [Chelonus insularis]